MIANDRRGATLDRLAEILDRYGARQSNWPTQDRDQLALLIARSNHAQALMRAAEKLEETLDTLRRPSPSAELVDNVLNQFPTKTREVGRSGRAIPRWMDRGQFIVAAASAAAAVVITVLALSYFQTDPAPASLLAIYFDDTPLNVDLDTFVNTSTVAAADEPAEQPDEDEVELIEVSIVALDDLGDPDELYQLSLD